jgi:hypothetical protein
MNKQVKPRATGRICDYFIVGGCGDELSLSCEDKQLAGYPTTSKTKPVISLDDVLALSFDPVVIDKYPVVDHQVRYDF